MTSELIVLATVGLAVGFLLVRVGFVDAMVAARQVDLRMFASELDRLADAGELRRDGAFYRYYHDVAMTVATTPTVMVPGLPAILWITWRGRGRATRPEGMPAYEDVEAEVSTALHRRKKTEFILLFLEIYRYRSFLVWALLKCVIALAVTVGTSILVYEHLGRYLDRLTYVLGPRDRGSRLTPA